MRSRRYIKKYYSRKSRYKKFKKLESLMVNFFAVIFLAVLVLLFKNVFLNSKIDAGFKKEYVKAFQIPNKTMSDLKALSDKYKIKYSELITIYSFSNNFFPVKTSAPTATEIEQNLIINYDKIKAQYKNKDVQNYEKMFEAILTDFAYFPIPKGYDLEETPSYMYGDSWESKITEDKYKGTEIVDRENMPGRVPVMSISSGAVKEVSFSEDLGNSVKILSENNVMFIYSRLDKITDGISLGTEIKAGDQIGFVGKSAKKPDSNLVYLLIQISYKGKELGGDFTINPYPFLRFREGSKVDLTPKAS